MGVVVVALLVAGGTALKLYMDQQSMLSMIGDYGQTIARLPVSSGPAAKALATANHYADRGEYATAREALSQAVTLVSQSPGATTPPGLPGQMPRGGGPVPGLGFGPNPGDEPPSPSDEEIDQAINNELPEETQAFFGEHRDLLSRLMVQNRITEGAIPPDQWSEYTGVVLSAAAQGDTETVKAAMERFDSAIRAARQGGGPGGPGGMPGPGRMGEGGIEEAIRAQIGQARGIVAEAKKRGANTKKIENLIARAETLAGEGKFEEADAKLREVVGLMRSWGGGPQGGRGGRPGGGGRPGMGNRPGMRRPGMGNRPGGPGGPPQGGNPMMMAQMILGALIGQMETEEPLIFGAIEDIENAGHAMLEYNQEQIREILNKAKEKLAAIPKKRIELDQQMSAAMQQGPPQGGQRPPGNRGGEGPRGPRPDRRGPGQGGPGGGMGRGPDGPGMGGPANPQQVRNLLGRMIDNARNMPAEQYEAERDGLINRFIARLMGGSGGDAPPSGPVDGGMPTDVQLSAPRVEIPEEEPSDPEARDALETQVRGLMRLIQEPYIDLRQLELEIDLELIDQLIDSARDDVNQGKLLDAAGNANHASELVFQLVQMHGPELQALNSRPETSAEPVEDSE